MKEKKKWIMLLIPILLFNNCCFASEVEDYSLTLEHNDVMLLPLEEDIPTTLPLLPEDYIDIPTTLPLLPEDYIDIPTTLPLLPEDYNTPAILPLEKPQEINTIIDIQLNLLDPIILNGNQSDCTEARIQVINNSNIDLNVFISQITSSTFKILDFQSSIHTNWSHLTKDESHKIGISIDNNHYNNNLMDLGFFKQGEIKEFTLKIHHGRAFVGEEAFDLKISFEGI